MKEQNYSEGAPDVEKLNLLMKRCERFLKGESASVRGFPFHGLRNERQVTIMGVYHILVWVLSGRDTYKGTEFGFEGQGHAKRWRNERWEFRGVLGELLRAAGWLHAFWHG